MKVLLFAAGAAEIRRLRQLKNRRNIQYVVAPLGEMRSVLETAPADVFIYIDVAGLEVRERSRAFAAIGEFPRLRFGVIDPAGVVKDVAALFHGGVVDYLGRQMGAAALTAARLAAIGTYAPPDVEELSAAEGPDAETGPSPAAVESWAGIADGRTYRFAFLFVEVDHAEELKKRHEPDNLASAMVTFKNYVEGIVTPYGGRPWMWSRFGGLVLFPLRNGSSPVALCGLRLFLSQIFYDVEESPLPGEISFRMALTVGSTVYHEKDTGGIVSDAINSIFHLGRRFTGAGRFVMTEEAAALAPAPLRERCVPEGTFEGRRILRLLRPRSPDGAGAIQCGS
jgi:hypothetical protein